MYTHHTICQSKQKSRPANKYIAQYIHFFRGKIYELILHILSLSGRIAHSLSPKFGTRTIGIAASGAGHSASTRK